VTTVFIFYPEIPWLVCQPASPWRIDLEPGPCPLKDLSLSRRGFAVSLKENSTQMDQKVGCIYTMEIHSGIKQGTMLFAGNYI
jgi:hypothetical protein